MPAGVHAKLLVAFVGTALLVVVVAVLGLRLLGQSNERVETLGTLQARAAAYGKLRSDTRHVRGCSPRGSRETSDKVFPELTRTRIRQRRPSASTRRSLSAASAASGFHLPRPPRIRAAARGRALPEPDPAIDEELTKPLQRSSRLVATSGRRDVSPDGRRARLPIALDQPRDRARERHDFEDQRPHRPERERLRALAQPVHRRGGGRDRPRTAARVRPLLVADRPDPEHRLPPGRDRLGRLLRARGRHQPRRARRAGDEREPDERRAQAPLPGARDREPAQVGLPGQHVARAADAAERDHRLLAGAARGHVRRGEREAVGVPRRHPLLGKPPALADQRRPRPVQGRSGPGRAAGRAVLAAGRPRARRVDGARTGDDRGRRGLARTRTGASTSSRATSGESGR